MKWLMSISLLFGLASGCATTHSGNAVRLSPQVRISCVFDHRYTLSPFQVIDFTIENIGQEPVNVIPQSLSIPGGAARVATTAEIVALRDQIDDPDVVGKHLLAGGVRLLPGETSNRTLILAAPDWEGVKHFSLCLEGRNHECILGELTTVHRERMRHCLLQEPYRE